MPPNQHALLSASSAHRWTHCTPSARLEQEFADISGDERGLLAVGIASTRGRLLLPRAIAAFRELKPGVRIMVEEDENENLVEIPLTVYLARPLGVFSPAWIPSPEAPAAEAEGVEETEEDAPESEPEEEDAE